MDKLGIEKARQRLIASKKHLAAIWEFEFDEPNAQIAWTEFLTSSNGFFAKLQQSAKGSDVAEAWYAEISKSRKLDELMNYMHQARNADEHQLLGTMEQTLKVQFVVYVGTPEETQRNREEREKLRQSGIRSTIPPLKSASIQESAKLVLRRGLWPKKLRNRGVEYPAPTTHLGENVGDLCAYHMAFLATQYMVAVLDSAENHFPR